MERLIGKYIFDPEMTSGKMIFLVGARQVGKTTFAKNWLAASGAEGTYFNWDDPAVKREFLRNPYLFKNIVDERFRRKPVPVVFDEIHKHRGWKNILKGVFDTLKERMRLLVTGSARLGMYRKSGDALVGRYFTFQMFPLGLPEAVGEFSHVLADGSRLSRGALLAAALRKEDTAPLQRALDRLLALGGFPEPFIKGSERFHTRWQREYKALIAKEEVRDFSMVGDLKGVEHLVELLPGRVGSPLSINSLREEAGTHHGTVTRWLDILDELYLVFTIRPFHRDIARSIRKEKKLYFWDWSMIPSAGARFENLIAVSLAKMAARFTENGLGEFQVMYIRDKEKHEVDFVFVRDGRPLALFEAKESDTRISPAGRHFSQRLGLPFYQVVRHCDRVEAFPGECFCIPAAGLLMLTG